MTREKLQVITQLLTELSRLELTGLAIMLMDALHDQQGENKLLKAERDQLLNELEDKEIL